MKKAIIGGTGKVGNRVYAPLIMDYGYNIIAYVDNDKTLQSGQGIYIGEISASDSK